MADDLYRIDSTKIQFHPKWVSEWMEKKDSWESAKTIIPIYVEIATVGACNHRCVMCSVDFIGYKAVQWDADLLIERANEMHSLGVKSIMWAGEGEPLLHKKINKIVEESKVDQSFTTNGTLLDKLETLHLCKWAKISINAGTRETYAKVHQTDAEDFDLVVESVRRAVKRKGDCTIGIQMVMLPENEHEVDEIRAIGEDLGVDYVVIKPPSQHKYSLNRQYETFKANAPLPKGKLVVRSASMNTTEIGYNKCLATPYVWTTVMATGEVYSCSAYLRDPRFYLGNLKERTFKDVWEGEERHKNWEFVREHLDIKECRLNCRQDKTNLWLTEFIGGPEHVNFV